MGSADVNESLVPLCLPNILSFFFYLFIPVPGMLKWLHRDSEMVIMLC